MAQRDHEPVEVVFQIGDDHARADRFDDDPPAVCVRGEIERRPVR
jgi:hypothetical protein